MRNTPSTRLYKRSEGAAEIFADLENIFACTNKTFFESRLSTPQFSFTSNPRSSGAFLPNRYASIDGGRAHGIAINSKHCQAAGDQDSMALVAFLSVQLARHEVGPESKNGKRGTPAYIDAWCRVVLDSMGLGTFVENSDDPRQLGYGLSVRVIEGGAFDHMCREMLVSGFRIRWHETALSPGEDSEEQVGSPPKVQKPSRVSYECPDCGLKALAKPGAMLGCWRCQLAMPPASETAS